MSDRQAEMHVPRLFTEPGLSQRMQRGRFAFTLVELLVSLGVLSIALAVIGTVFSITTQTASQAAAYSATQGWLRRFVMELEADLKGIVRSQSVLVIRGRTIPAGLAAGDIEAEEPKLYRVLVGNPMAPGLQNLLSNDPNSDPSRIRDLNAAPAVIAENFSDPRADQIMFLTNRPLASRAPALNVVAADQVGQALQNGTRFSPAFITYGHAALAEAYYDSAQQRYLPQIPSQWRHINQRRASNGSISTSAADPSRVPAQQWMLARRQMIVIDEPAWGADPGPNLIPLANWGADDGADGCSVLFGLGGTSNAGGLTVFGAGQGLANAAGDAIRMNLTMGDPPAGTGYDGPGFLTQLSRPVGGGTPPGLVNPYPTPGGVIAPNSAAPAPVPTYNGNLRSQLLSLMYPNGDDGNGAGLGPQTVAVAIPNPPPDLRANLNLQALPGCVWFQVEFLQPEDPRNHPEYFDWTPEDPSDNSGPSDAQRWVSVPNGALWTFVPDTAGNRQSILDGPFGGLVRSWDDFGALPRAIPAASGGPGNPPPVPGVDADYRDYIRVRTFPYAIRITVRATDPKGRLTEPVVRAVIHRFE